MSNMSFESQRTVILYFLYDFRDTLENKYFTHNNLVTTYAFVFQMSQDADEKRTRTRSKGIRGKSLLKTRKKNK